MNYKCCIFITESKAKAYAMKATKKNKLVLNKENPMENKIGVCNVS